MNYWLAPAELTPFRNPRWVSRNRRLRNRNNAIFDLNRRRTAEKWIGANNAVIGSIQYTYDGNNNLLTVIDTISGVNYEFQYDELNRKVNQYVNSAELDVPVEFTYTYNTQAKTITETLSGLIDGVVNDYYTNVFQYDTFNNLIGITQTGTNLTTKTVDYVYNRNGQRTGATYKQDGDIVSESNWAYDAANRISSIQHKTEADSVFAEYGFTQDAANRITEFETVDGTADYTYDATDQLTGADYDYLTDESYSYDDNGNRTMTGYETGTNNETLADGTYRYTIDAEGNRTEKFIWTDTNEDGIIDESEKTLVQTYEWDYRNRLSRVTNYENGVADEVISYLYDYLNQMIARSITADNITISEAYIYSNGQIVLEYNTSGSADVVKAVNFWGANVDELVATERLALSTNKSNQILWSYGDHLNSIRDVAIYNPTADSTTVNNHLIYDAFGNLVSSVDPTNSNTTISPILAFRYTGKYFDDATGLQNNLNRWYDATTGKWISVDPIGFNAGDTNLYRYVVNDVVSSLDYFGFSSTNINFNFDSKKVTETRLKSLLQDNLAYKDQKTGNIVVIDSFGADIRAMYLKRWKSCSNWYENWGKEVLYYVANVKSIMSLTHLNSQNVDADQFVNDVKKRAHQYLSLFMGEDDAARMSMYADAAEFTANMIPGYATADNLSKGNYGEAAISFAGDVAMFISGPLAKVCQYKNLVRIGIGIEAGVGATRSVQAGLAFYNGNTEAAIGYMGEGAMRLFGAGEIFKNSLKRVCFTANTQVVVDVNKCVSMDSTILHTDTVVCWQNYALAGVGIGLVGLSVFIKHRKNQDKDLYKTCINDLIMPIRSQQYLNHERFKLDENTYL